MLHRSLVLATLSLLMLAPPASASVIRCWGKMRTLDCRESDQFWNPGTHPTFGAGCEACGSTPDGGGVCMPLEVGPYLSLKVGDRSYGPEHFEALGTSCETEQLFRYKGPLEPGQSHEILLPGNVDYSRPMRFAIPFAVTGELAIDPGPATTDTGAPATVPGDAGADSAASQVLPEPSGCSYTPLSDRPSTAVAGALLVAWLSLRRLARRAR
jgi:hypothetical protein